MTMTTPLLMPGLGNDVICLIMDTSLLILDNDLILETTKYWDFLPDNSDLFELMTGQ